MGIKDNSLQMNNNQGNPALIAEIAYGKDAVRVLIIDPERRYRFVEWRVCVLLEGHLQRKAYLSPNNDAVIPTDTIKNTIYYLAASRQRDFSNGPTDEMPFCMERFATILCGHFLETYEASLVDTVRVTIARVSWHPQVALDGPHVCYEQGLRSPADWPAFHVRSERRGQKRPLELLSGLMLTMIKCGGSAFLDFHHDPLTTLTDASDRVLRMRLSIAWTIQEGRAEERGVMGLVKEISWQIFSKNVSPSLQYTLYQIGHSLLKRAPMVTRVRLEGENLHAFPVDLTAFGLAKQNTVCQPSEEPHGLITITLDRHLFSAHL